MFKRSYFTSRLKISNNSEDGAICNNNLKLKAIYYSFVTRSYTLSGGRGPRSGFDYNGIS